MIAFVNEPTLELRREAVRTRALDALAALDARLPLAVPMLIGGAPRAGEPLGSVDPSAPEVVVAVAQGAAARDVDDAVALAGGPEGRAWGARSAIERADVLERAAGLLAAQRRALAALAVRECAKPWAEADGDVCEAIDFLRYYAAGARESEANPAGVAPLLQPPGERNTMSYRPRGVVGVIAPWNFPLAIATGMTAAALATGNAAVLKPAPQAPACAHAIVGALHAAGVPGAALALLPGGDEPGRALVAHPGVHAIAFTGSGAAGLAIIRSAAEVPEGQHFVKRVVAEMGGKNAIVVDADADLDEAVPGIVASAFGFAGQKCSAASRVLVCEGVAEALLIRLGGAVAALRVGPAADFASDVGPVIDAESQARLLDAIAEGMATGRVAGQAVAVPQGGFYVPPTVLAGLPAGSPLIERELFGPVLVVETVVDVAEACERLDASPYALTAGLFSRSPATVTLMAQRCPAGNLYVNREITGAMVGRQPFGGGRLSGIGVKAGGPGYLEQFAQAHVVTENTMRHGLVV